MRASMEMIDKNKRRNSFICRISAVTFNGKNIDELLTPFGNGTPCPW